MRYSNSLLLSSFLMIFVFAEAGTLKGHVKYDGKAPKKKRLRMDADPVCGSSHSGAVYSENFKMAEDGSMAEALVYLRDVSYSGGVPSEPAVLDQKRLYLYTSCLRHGCWSRPSHKE